MNTDKPIHSGHDNNIQALLANLLLNIVIPTLVLTKLSGDDYLGVKGALIVAILFPLTYGLKDFRQKHKINFFSALGLINVILTGGIGLLELDPKYIAIKEASIPALFGIATLVSLRTPYPLIKTLIYNDMILNIQKIEDSLEKKCSTLAFEKTMLNANYIVAASFFLSSILNYTLARYIVVSQPGTEAFNAELGKMTALSYPVIAIPSTLVLVFALWYLFSNIQRLTDMEMDDIMRHPSPKTSADKTP